MVLTTKSWAASSLVKLELGRASMSDADLLGSAWLQRLNVHYCSAVHSL